MQRPTERATTVRSLERGLAVLLALNRLRSASVLEIAAETRLARPTIYRILETLRGVGLVARDGLAERYRLTQRVRALSDGYDEEEWISGIARPLLKELGREVAWPLSLFTFDDGRMLVRETTHEQSALSVDRGMVGQRLPMLRTAAGRAYLAFCPEKERGAIILLLAHSEEIGDRAIRDPRRIASMLRAARMNGFATQWREINSKTASISVPILAANDVLGCLSVIWIAKALSIEQAADRYVALLKAAAARIGSADIGDLGAS